MTKKSKNLLDLTQFSDDKGPESLSYTAHPKPRASVINFTDSAVAITKGGRFIAQSFKFPDGTDGSLVIIKKTERKNWIPDITTITINYENNTSSK